jgi:putative hydrolase of the HAD superfamily
VSRAALERGYDAAGAYLGDVWRAHRDVPVTEHLRVMLATVDPALPARVTLPILNALVEAYARPALLEPPTVEPTARAALQALCARGYTLALVSNTMRTPGTILRQLLARHGLLDCFAHATFSDEVGVRKPAPAIFALALAAVGGEPATAVHVGDDPVLDVAGARAAGMRVIQVGGADGPAAGAHAVVRTLAAVPAAVARLDA